MDTGQLCPDIQSRSHALALAIVVWNLRNPFDQHGVSVWVLFWMAPEDKTAIRQGKERTDRGDTVQGLPDEYTNLQHTFESLGHGLRLNIFISKNAALHVWKTANYMQSFRKKMLSRRWKRKKNNIPVHIVWMTRVERRSTQIFYLPLHYFAPLHSKGIPSFLFDLSIPQTESECKVRACVCMCVRDTSAHLQTT